MSEDTNTERGPAGDDSLPLLVRPFVEGRRPDDVKRLREAINQLGFDATDQAIQEAYEDYSEAEYCAGWMSLGIWPSCLDAAKHLIKRGYLVEANVK